MFALSSSKRTLFAAIFATALLPIAYVAAAQESDADDPPAEAGRISYVSGNVSIQPVTSDQWGQAYPNLPLGPGDRIFTDNDGRAEIQIGRTYVRIGPNSDVTLVDDSQFNINFGVAQGAVRLHSFGLWQRQLVDISTPNGNAEFAQQGDLRIDVIPNDGASVFTNLGQFADITAAGNYRQELDYGQSLEIAGSNPVYPQWLQPAGPDDLDAWSQDRDQRMANVASYNYVSPDIEGAADLDSSGDWQPQTDFGAMWFPRNVPADWEPYHNGHWINRDPWGWVWVEDESWGYAPFHYGRWARYNNRWGWVPGPVNVRPVWSPALVVFAGGGGGGVGLSVWFPLGPGEAYRPWYRCSPRYIDRVNITNIREAPRVHVERSYVNIVNVTNVTNVTYVNRTYVTAMHQNDFASGRQVRDVAVRVDPREMQQMRPLAQPQVAAPSRPIISRPVAHPVPVSVQRPMLINQQGKQIVARPGAAPVAPPVHTAPPVKPLLGRTVVAAPAHPAPNRPGFQAPNQSPAAQGNNQYQRPNNQPGQAYPGGTPRANPVGVAPGGERNLNSQPGNQPGVNQNQHPVEPTGRPVPPTYQQQERPNQPTVQQPNQPNYQQPRPNQPTYQQPGQPNPQQPQRPNYQQPNEQQRPNQPNQRNDQQQPRPNQPTGPQPPRANQPQTPPPVQNRRQDFGPVQPDKHQDQAPTPPNGNPNQGRPVQPPPQDRQVAPPPRPNYQPQDRPAPQNRSADQPRPNQQSRPQQNDKQNNKDQKKDDKDKKDDKKHD
jgi:hypothetical protein